MVGGGVAGVQRDHHVHRFGRPALVKFTRDRKESKSMNPAEQVLAKKADRLRIVKMDAVIEVAVTEELKTEEKP